MIVIYDADNIAVARGKNLRCIKDRARRMGCGQTTLRIIGADLIVTFPDRSACVAPFADRKVLYAWARTLVKRNPGRFCDSRGLPL